jgi:hypothetical protein
VSFVVSPIASCRTLAVLSRGGFLRLGGIGPRKASVPEDRQNPTKAFQRIQRCLRVGRRTAATRLAPTTLRRSQKGAQILPDPSLPSLLPPAPAAALRDQKLAAPAAMLGHCGREPGGAVGGEEGVRGGGWGAGPMVARSRSTPARASDSVQSPPPSRPAARPPQVAVRPAGGPGGSSARPPALPATNHRCRCEGSLLPPLCGREVAAGCCWLGGGEG